MKIGINLYGLRFILKDGIENTLNLLKQTGFDCVEPIINIGNQELKETSKYENLVWRTEELIAYIAKINNLGLLVPSIHCFFDEQDSVLDLAGNIKKLNEEAKIKYFVFSGMLKNVEECDRFGKLLTQLVQAIDNQDIKICYHNHETEFELCNADGKDQYLLDYFMAQCPEQVTLQMDLGWVKFADVSPLEYILNNNRVTLLHLKDLIPGYSPEIRKQSFTAVGKGVVGYKEILADIHKLDLFEDGPLVICQDNSNEDLMSDLKSGISFINTYLS